MDRYRKSFTVRWLDIDYNGHMRNTSYSEYGTDTRIAYLAENGFPFERFVALRFGPVIMTESLEYLREVHLGQTITVDLAILGLSPDGARFKFEHEIWLPEGKKAGRIVLAGGWIDLEKRRLRVPPEDLQRAMREGPRAEGFEELKPLSSRS